MAEERNPYEPPKADLSLSADPQVSLDGAPAAARFGNFLIDGIASLILAFGVELALAASLDVSPWSGVQSRLVTYGTMIVYYVLLESLTGWTIGKLITGTRVVSERGGRPTFGQIVGRTLSRFVPFEPLSLLGVNPRGWHDRWSGTQVVKIRR